MFAPTSLSMSSILRQIENRVARMMSKVANVPLMKGDAYSRLENILKGGEVWASTMPWTNQKAVCFTECTWGSLLDHAKQYSPFGIGFSKAFLFACGGGPAIYMRADLYKKQRNIGGFEASLHSFITPFWPIYAPKFHRDRYYGSKRCIDYTHEREWRVPRDLKFTPQKVAFVIVNKYEDMAKLSKEVKDTIGRDKFLDHEQLSQGRRVMANTPCIGQM